LLDFDQLSTLTGKESVHQHFNEHDIGFAPTYKHKNHSSGWATDKKGGVKRTPAYTDRILWRSHPDPHSKTKFTMTQRDYTSAELLMSDHRPVSATFDWNLTYEEKPRLVSPDIYPIVGVDVFGYRGLTLMILSASLISSAVLYLAGRFFRW